MLTNWLSWDFRFVCVQTILLSYYTPFHYTRLVSFAKRVMSDCGLKYSLEINIRSLLAKSKENSNFKLIQTHTLNRETVGRVITRTEFLILNMNETL